MVQDRQVDLGILVGPEAPMDLWLLAIRVNQVDHFDRGILFVPLDPQVLVAQWHPVLRRDPVSLAGRELPSFHLYQLYLVVQVALENLKVLSK